MKNTIPDFELFMSELTQDVEDEARNSGEEAYDYEDKEYNPMDAYDYDDDEEDDDDDEEDDDDGEDTENEDNEDDYYVKENEQPSSRD